MSEQLRAEFGRQAAPMEAAAAFNEQATLQKICAALGPPPVGRVLEMACGPGIVAEQLAVLAEELVCVDATPEMLALARARLERAGRPEVVFMAAFAEALPFANAEFDAIVTRLSFHHFADLKTVLAEIRRVLRPQGRLVVADIVASADHGEARLHNALERLRDPTHVRMLSRPELLAALADAEFAILSDACWEQPRQFTEWAKIVALPERTEPLREIMATLCHAGLQAGIQLREFAAEVHFTHTWVLVAAKAPGHDSP